MTSLSGMMAGRRNGCKPREEDLSSDDDSDGRGLHVQLFDPVSQFKRPPDLGFGIGGHQVILDQEIEHPALDDYAGNLDLLYIDRSGSRLRADSGGHGNGPLAVQEIGHDPPRRVTFGAAKL